MRWLCVVLLGAAAAGEPAWWSQPPADGRRYGRGLGATAEAAVERAAADLALQLVASVSAARETETVVVSGSQGGALAERSVQRQRIETRLAQLPGLTRVAEAEVEGVHYALVAIEPAALRAACAPALAELDRALAALPLAPPRPLTAAWAAQLRAALPLAEERALLAALLAGLGEAVPEPPCTPARLHAALGGLRQPPQLCFSGGEQAASVARGLLAAAAGAGYVVVDEREAPPWRMALREERSEQRLPRGWVRVRLRGEARLLRRGREESWAVFAAESEGISTRDAAAAYQQAGERLAEQIAAQCRERLPALFHAAPPDQ
ncbi:MAG: hypothetical protein N3B15_04630 [Planctomycetota bacterium]|nr:hypothetical protein [Planctomycetota bacterium]